MKHYLISIGPDVWALVLQEYKVPKAIPSEEEDKRSSGNMQRHSTHYKLG